MLNFNECIKQGLHLGETDNDGFCLHCGHQELAPFAISTSDGHDETWTYYTSELEAHETFIYMQGYEIDIHLYNVNKDNEYEVIDSFYTED